MAKKIDERVVSMQFDNKNFEKNVAQSMSTLDKLKEKLSFRGASKAMDELNSSMKKFDGGPFTRALDTVGDQAKRKVSAWTETIKGFFRKLGEDVEVWAKKTVQTMSGVENVKLGWGKYGDETKAVATLRAQGYELDRIEGQLEQLLFFTDETSYNFTDMVGEIGKFTAAGQGLEESLIAMQGIASWAALSGQNAQVASRAMYQLSQAMGAGIMRKEDYKSIQNASMDTQQFRQRALDAAVALGTLKEVSEGVYQSLVADVKDPFFTIDQFANHLTEDLWFTSDVMMAVFKDYGKASIGLKAYMDINEMDTASDAIASIREEAHALAEEMVALGEEKSIEEAMDNAIKTVSLKTFEEDADTVAKANAFMKEYNANLKDGENRIETVQDALVEMGYIIDEFSLAAFEAGQQARTWEDAVGSVVDAVSSKWSKTFKYIFGNEEEAVELWTRFANDFYDIFAAGGDDRNTIFAKLREWVSPENRDKYQKALDSIATQGEEAKEAIRKAYTINFRDLLFSTEEGNLGAIIQLLESLKTLLSTVKDAWNEIFYGTSDADEVAQQKADGIMALVQAIKKFADALKIDDATADKLKRTFKGLFSILDIAKTLISDIFGAIGKIISPIFGKMEGGILDVTSGLGDWLTQLRDWIKENDYFGKILSGLGTIIGGIVGWIKNIIDNLRRLPWVIDIVNGIRDGFGKAIGYVTEFFDRLGGGEKSSDILVDIANRLRETSGFFAFVIDVALVFKDTIMNVFNGVKGFLQGIIDTIFKNGFGLAPIINGVTDAVTGGMSSLWDGTKSFFGNITTMISGFVDTIIKFAGEINFDKLANIMGTVTLFIFIFKLLSLFKTITTFISNFLDIAEQAVTAFKNIASGLNRLLGSLSTAIDGIGKAIKNSIQAKTFKIIAESILVLVAAVGLLYVMALYNPNALTQAAIIIGSLATGFVLLSIAAGRAKNLYRTASAIAAFGVALLALTIPLTMIASLNDKSGLNQAVGAIAALSGIMLLISLIAALAGKFLNMIGPTGGGFNVMMKSLAIFMLSFAGSVMLIGFAAKSLAAADTKGLDMAIRAIWSIVGSLSVLVAVTKIFNGGNLAAAGKMMVKLSASLLIIAGAVALFSLFDQDVFSRGIGRIMIVGAFFAALIAVSKLAGEYGKEAGSMLLKMSFALFALIGVIALIQLLSAEAIFKGLVVISALGGFAAALIAVSKLAGEHARKAGTMLLMVSVALTLLTGVMWALSLIPTEGLTKAAIVVSGLMLVFGYLIAMTKFAAKTKNLKATLLSITIAIGVLAASVAALTLISNHGDIIKAGLALALVLGVFGAIIGLMKLAEKVNGLQKSLWAMTAVIGVIGIVLFALAQTQSDSSEALKNAGAIALVLGVMGGITILFAKLTENLKVINFVIAIAAMAGLTALAWWISSFISEMNNIDGSNAIENAGAIAILLGTMAVIVLILGGVSALAGTVAGSAGPYGAIIGVITVAALATSILAMGGLIEIAKGVKDLIIALKEANVTNALDNAHAIGDLLLALTASYAILSLSGALILSAAAGLLGFKWFIDSLKSMLEELGKLAPDVKEAVQNGIPMLEMLGKALGSFAGNIIGGFIESVSSGVFVAFILFGLSISKFYDLITPFLDGMANLDNDTFEKIKAFAAALLILTAAELIDSLSKFVEVMGTKIAPENSAGGLSTFITNLESLGSAAVTFSDTIKGKLDKESIDIAVEMIKGLGSVAPDPNSDWTYFADNLKLLGTGIAEFSAAVVGKMNFESMQQAATIIKKLGEVRVADRSLFDDSHLAYFKTRLPNLAEGLAAFSAAVDGKLNPTYMGIACTYLERLSMIDLSMFNDNGWFDGITDLEAFSSVLIALGTGIFEFSKQTTGGINSSGANKAADVLAYILTAIEHTPSGLGGLQAFILDLSNDYKYIASTMKSLGEGVANFSRQVSGGAVSKTASENAIDILTKLMMVEKVAEALNSIGSNLDLAEFSSNMSTLGEGLNKFNEQVKNIDDVDKLKTAVAALTILASIDANVRENGAGGFDFVKSISNMNNISVFAENLTRLGSALNGFAIALNQNGINFGTTAYSVTTAVDCLQRLSQIQEDVSGQGSAWDFVKTIAGMSGINTFVGNIGVLARGLAGFSKALAEDGGLNREAMESAVSALEDLGRINSVLELVADENKIESYIVKLEAYANAITSIAESMKEVYKAAGEMNVKNLNPLTETLNTISTYTGYEDVTRYADVSKNIDPKAFLPTDALKGMKDENSSILYNTDWAEQYKTGFTNQINSSFGYEDLYKAFGVEGGAGSNFTNALLDSALGQGNADAIAEKIPGFGDLINKTFSNFNLTDLFSQAGGAGESVLGGILGSIPNIDVDSMIKQFAPDLQSTLGSVFGQLDFSAITGGEGGFGEGFLGGITEFLSGGEATGKLEEAGKGMGSNLIAGITSKKMDLTTAGGDAVNGFINGITTKAKSIEAAGKEMAASLETGLTMTLKIQSPSKVMYGLGNFAVLGFTNALNDGIKPIQDSGDTLATSATDAIRNSLAQASDIFNLSVDTEPTIRPVLDLTNIEEGAEKVSEALNADQAITLDTSSRLAANIDAGTIQNSITVDNSDVIKSIDNLNTNMLDIADRLSKLEVRMDTGALVGELVAPMDSALGSRTIRRGRG